MLRRFFSQSKNALQVLIPLFTVCALLASPFLLTQQVYAADEAADPVKAAAAAAASVLAPLSSDPAQSGQTTLDSIEASQDSVVIPVLTGQLLRFGLELVTGLVDRAAYEAAVAVSAGGPAQQPLFFGKGASENWKTFGLDVVAESIQILGNGTLEQIDLKFDVCAPNDLISASIAFGLKQAYQPRKPKCEWRNLNDNWEAFIASYNDLYKTAKADPNQFVLRQLARGFRPGQNELSAAIKISHQATQEYVDERARLFQTQLASGGFKPVIDFVTGNVKTPSATVADQFNNALWAPQQTKTDTAIATTNEASDLGTVGVTLLADLGRVFASTFTNTWLSRTLTGLFTPQADFAFDLGDFEGSQGTGQYATDDLKTLLAVNPISITSYSALAEFITCPPDEISPRGPNNCVLDPQLASLLNKNSDQILTIRDAVEQGYLHGDWPLIPPTDSARNQDRLCYQSAYCYSNLVKLRKARILPVGWELAAKANNPAAPATLQQIMDAFDACAEGNARDADHPWCHLIDPNWILKYPEFQCRATTYNDLLATNSGGIRGSSCVDTPSCIAEDASGRCVGGYGYCVQEKNVWQFSGESCVAEYATCLSVSNTRNQDRTSVLYNTVDTSVCGADNAGCRWYRTTRAVNDQGTTTTADDTSDWLAPNENYVVADWDAAIRRGTEQEPGGTTSRFAFEDRIYFNKNIQTCAASGAGCTELIPFTPDTVVNIVQNGSFEAAQPGDTVPTGWTSNGAVHEIAQDVGVSGPRAVQVSRGEGTLALVASIGQKDLLLAPNTFYTFSFHAQGVSDTANAQATIRFAQQKDGGVPANLARYFAGPGCVAFKQGEQQVGYLVGGDLVASSAYKRFSCTFTTADEPVLASVLLFAGSGSLRYDDVQLEIGETTHTFTESLVSTEQKAFLKVPPIELGCRGLDTDPAACSAYAPVCSYKDIGCDLFVPLDGDPSVPAKIAASDFCPNECVGYTTYREEATPFSEAEFPLHFIASTAQACTAQEVGCTEFTNLSNEQRVAFTELRACQTLEEARDRESTYFTWEGSDTSGFQLRRWQLLSSNVADTAPGKTINAPCRSWKMLDEQTMVCEDTSTEPVVGCRQNSDLFVNPDCREFYDAEGDIYYTLFSQTVSVTDSCIAYRQTTSTQDSCLATGGLWLPSGECRRLANPAESRSCKVEASGCRAYTGGTSRNTRTVLDTTFESGSYAPLTAYEGGTVTLSNESLANGGHSVLISGASGKGAQTEVTPGTPPSTAFSDLLLNEKTYTLEFWAKGTGLFDVLFIDEEGREVDLVTRVNEDINLGLNPEWQLYRVGPITLPDTASFDVTTARLVWRLEQRGSTLYLDNILLRQSPENLTLVKNSWKTPVSCDTAPNGAISPQYHLGCEAYKNRAAQTVTVSQFSRLCSEKVIGCQAFVDTQQTDATHGQFFGARCEQKNGVPVTAATPCILSGTTFCTIQTGRTFCTFDRAENPPATLADGEVFRLALGPETTIVTNDLPIYLVDSPSARCSSDVAGCMEVGAPVFSQDQSRVERFESTFVLNRPADYERTLCDHEALFCEEWATTDQGTIYFKDPIDKTCEYRSNVNLDGRTTSGWFRANTNEPCDFDDVNNDGRFTLGVDQALIQSGDRFGVWRNGDDAYEGWVATCPAAEDRCTEFLDTSDTHSGEYTIGKPYFFINDDVLNRSNNRCEGQVSQKEGCALFQDRTNTERLYNTSASYIASVHADTLFGDEPNDLRAAIDCRTPEGGKIVNPPGLNGQTVDLCSNRCAYRPRDGVTLLEATMVGNNGNVYTGSCLFETDCPVLKGTDGNSYAGTCSTGVSANLRLENDANTIVAVERDRECAEWLDCKSEQTTWDPSKSQWVNICNEVGLCNEYGRNGDQSFCASWSRSEPIPLTAEAYASRNITWTGEEYSGYAIPDQLPVDLYDQVNINPNKWCFNTLSTKPLRDGNNNVIPCATTESCPQGAGVECATAPSEYRLAFAAGSCEANQPWGDSCQIGFCEESGVACSGADDCSGDQECIIGSCQLVNANAVCTSSAQCSGNTPVCDLTRGQCVDALAPTAETCAVGRSCTGGKECVPAPKTRTGTCLNSICLTGLDGKSLAVYEAQTADLVCRGYPEANAPFSSDRTLQLVSQWQVPGASPAQTPNRVDAQAYARKGGFENVSVCSPTKSGNGWEGSDCSCSYTKLQYGKNTALTRYYPVTYSVSGDRVAQGLCSGGSKEGTMCDQDSDCNNGNERATDGVCLKISRSNEYHGFQGYCLERDSSIQAFGSAASSNQLCLTWLPIDQPTGATDLYAKYVNAGFAPQEVSFCAETEVSYNVYTRPRSVDGPAITDVACADQFECRDSAQDPSDPGFWGAQSCDDNVDCPNGFFAILGGCDENNPESGSGEDQSCGDDACPFWCVPYFSVHAKDASLEAQQTFDLNWEAGDPCLPPIVDETTGGATSPLDPALFYPAPTTHNGTVIYGASGRGGRGYNQAKFYYNDCVVAGISPESHSLYLTNDQDTDYDEGDSFSFSGSFDDEYLACSTLVEVGQEQLSQGAHFNKAWTNRLWSSGLYTIRDESASYRYQRETAFPPFGAARSWQELLASVVDPRPVGADACRRSSDGSLIPRFANESCPPGTQPLSDYREAGVQTSGGYECTRQSASDLCCVNTDPQVPGVNCQPRRVAIAEPFDENGQPTDTHPSCLPSPAPQRILECAEYGSLSSDPVLFQRHVGQIFGAGTELVEWQDGDLGEKVDEIATGPGGPTRQEALEDMARQWQESWMGTYVPARRVAEVNRWTWDLTASGDPTGITGPNTTRKKPTAPKVISIGSCTGAECREGSVDSFSVNGANAGVVDGGNGFKGVTVSFFTYADPDQLPIRSINVDWGDGDYEIDQDKPWPTTSQSGSKSATNFYKNHRGLSPSGQAICGGQSNFGETTEACDSSYVTFTHSYVCSAAEVRALQQSGRTCQLDGSGRLVNSPCTGGSVPQAEGKCIFQPRVHVKDNWGWCTGSCPGGADGTGGCYEDTSEDIRNLKKDECNITLCPGDTCLSEGGRDGSQNNPWINFDGYIRIDPKKL